jgi:hypothetical protein
MKSELLKRVEQVRARELLRVLVRVLVIRYCHPIH